MELGRLATELGLPFEGDPAHEVTGLAGLEDAGPHDLSFIEPGRFESPGRYLRTLERSRAGVVIAAPGLDIGKRACLRSPGPYADFARAIPLFYPRSIPAPGIHPTAVIGEGVSLGADVSIGAYCVLGAGCSLGDRSVLYPHVTVYPGVRIGADCMIHAGCCLREGVRIGARAILQNGVVIGSEGFGFALDADGRQRRVPHRCGVEIGDDFEIGANSTIDASHPAHSRHGHPSVCTRIGSGVKIDNQVQIAHGCFIEDRSQLCAQVGLAGSTWVGRGVFMAGQSGAKGHVHIGAGSIIGGATGVTSDVEPGSQILGVPPGVDRRLWGRIVAAWKRLPNLLTRVRELEKRIEELEGSRRE